MNLRPPGRGERPMPCGWAPNKIDAPGTHPSGSLFCARFPGVPGIRMVFFIWRRAQNEKEYPNSRARVRFSQMPAPRRQSPTRSDRSLDRNLQDSLGVSQARPSPGGPTVPRALFRILFFFSTGSQNDRFFPNPWRRGGVPAANGGARPVLPGINGIRPTVRRWGGF